MLTLLFGIIGLIALLYAIKQGKKAKIAEQKIIDIEQAMTSYKYLKDKAFDYYYKGNYEESLDVFKKYLLNNNDDKEWNEVIQNIFLNETKKIFSDTLVIKDTSIATLAIMIQTFITFENKFLNSSQYPKIIKILINDYFNAFQHKRPYSELIIAFFDKDWSKAKEIIPTLNMISDKELNTSFIQYITKYINKKLGINDDSFVDDIPF
jgi:tetratricopeptide (TPR) repeat protein